MEIPNPASIGFTSSDENVVSNEFRYLLLAFNLLLCRVCILGTYTTFSNFDIIPTIPESQSHVKKNGWRYEVNFVDQIAITDHIFVEIGTKDSVEENHVVNLFGLDSRR